MSKRGQSEEWRWAEGKVDPAHDHLGLYFREEDNPIALIGQPDGNCFPVEFLVDRTATHSTVVERRRAVRAELDFYLCDVGRPNPWNYAIYHCGTAANVYSTIHWRLAPAAAKQGTASLTADP